MQKFLGTSSNTNRPLDFLKKIKEKKIMAERSHSYMHDLP